MDRIHAVCHSAHGLQVVVVNDGHNVVNFLGRGKHGRLPHLTFGQFAVAQDAIDAIGFLVQPIAKAMPLEMDNPCPSEPVLASMPGVL